MIIKLKVLLTLLFCFMAGIIAAQKISKKERKECLKYLNVTLEQVQGLVEGLSDEQLNFQVSPEVWSIQDNVEHLYKVEKLTRAIIDKALESGHNIKVENRTTDEEIISKMAVRTNETTRLKAPEVIQPKNEFKTFSDALSSYADERAATLAHFQISTSSNDLRNYLGPHPLFGQLDAYQWYIFIAAHNERHVLQMKELMESLSFPKH